MESKIILQLYCFRITSATPRYKIYLYTPKINFFFYIFSSILSYSNTIFWYNVHSYINIK